MRATRPAFSAPSAFRGLSAEQPGRIHAAGVWRCVIACDKREAFAQGSASDEAIPRIGKTPVRFAYARNDDHAANWLFEIRIGNLVAGNQASKARPPP